MLQCEQSFYRGDEMTTTTVTIPDIKVQLTVEQLITAVRQLEPGERAKIARALADTELDTELTQLITELYSQPPVDEITDDDILAEIRAVRQQRA
jgi:hypothetical protein